MTILGADVDGLDGLAGEMLSAADRLDGTRARVRLLLYSVPWNGEDAAGFKSDWERIHSVHLNTAVGAIRTAAATLKRNAAEQRQASLGDASPSHAPFWILRALGILNKFPLTARDRELAWADGPGNDQLKSEVHSTPAEQLAWWNSLAPWQRQALLRASPSMLLLLTGLPRDVRAQANQAAIQSMRDTIAVDTDTKKVEAGVTIRFVKLGADGQIVETHYADGHYEVTVSGGGEIGAEFKKNDIGGSVTADGEVSRTYAFASQSAADKFTHGLLDAAIPKVGNPWILTATLASPGSLIAGSAVNIADYLKGYSAISTKVSGSLNQDVSVGAPDAGKVSLHEGSKVEHDLQSGETTASLEIKGEGTGDLGPYQGAVGAGGTVEVAWKGDGHIESLTFKGDFSAQGGVGASGPVEASDLAGLNGSFQMKIDLADPANRNLAMNLLAKTSSGDVKGAAHDFARLRDSSEIVVQANTMKTVSGGVDDDVKAKMSDVKIHNIATWVKPAHGHFAKLGS